MAYVVDLEEGGEFADSSEIPTTLIRSKADCPQEPTRHGVSTNDLVIQKLTQILSYLRMGKREKKKAAAAAREELAGAGGGGGGGAGGSKRPTDNVDMFGEELGLHTRPREGRGSRGSRVPEGREKGRERDRSHRDRDRERAHDRERERERERPHRDRDRDRGERTRAREKDREPPQPTGSAEAKRSYFQRPEEREPDSKEPVGAQEFAKSVVNRFANKVLFSPFPRFPAQYRFPFDF